MLHDLVRGTDATLEAAALAMVSLHLGLVMDSTDLTAAWSRSQPPAASPAAQAWR